MNKFIAAAAIAGVAAFAGAGAASADGSMIPVVGNAPVPAYGGESATVAGQPAVRAAAPTPCVVTIREGQSAKRGLDAGCMVEVTMVADYVYGYSPADRCAHAGGRIAQNGRSFTCWIPRR